MFAPRWQGSAIKAREGMRYLFRRDRREMPKSRPKANTRPVTNRGFSRIALRSSAALICPLGACISIISSSSSSEKSSLPSSDAGIVLVLGIDYTVKYVFVST
jgi:hypothetical protein